ncbi:hypothetical protein [uncultured Sphingomonas sp.]|uniref:hypothetical protein n=1 Tax=uncultured Sphingomonas sp. TaxID=158754 RepID=UPI0025F1D90A|nr:hypothetical protein [uncultured Sphingomonas sp.]
MKVDAILLKPLDGDAPGSPRSFDKVDFDRLRAMAAVREAREDDDVAPAPDESAVLLERFRHPTDGPKLLADMKASFESLGRARDELVRERDAARDEATDLATRRDDAVRERDEVAASAKASGEKVTALEAEIEQLKAAATAKPAGKKPA